MSTLLIEPQYLGNISYYSALLNYEKVIFEHNQHFSKQSYKNRCQILTSQGTQSLVVPVKFGNRTPFKEVRIDNSQSWRRVHWGAIYSSYGKAPFFEYFSEYFKSIYDRDYEYVLDLNLDLMTICLKLLQCDITYALSEGFQSEPENAIKDLREAFHPKKPLTDRIMFSPQSYGQHFGNDFVSNLSILDLLFAQGPQSNSILKNSVVQLD